METSSSSSLNLPPAVTQSLLEALTSRGWCFKDVEQVRALIAAQFSSTGGKSCTVDSLESELLKMDLRSIGGKSLPEISQLRQTSHLPGPKVLQVSSAKDITKSNVDEISGNSSSKRLLKLKLTDGHSEITAIEFSHIPSLPDKVVRGTKVRLENKAMVRNGIVCLDAKVTRVLGGVVQTLYEEWQMDQKYSGFSRSSARPSDENAASGPPPFEKLQIGASLLRKSKPLVAEHSKLPADSSGTSGSSTSRQPIKPQSNITVDRKTSDIRPPENSAEERGVSVADARQKEVAESVPVQNQAAAQKLLQRMNQPNQGNQHFRGRRHGRREKEEDTAVLTLEEWERRKAAVGSSTSHSHANVNQDEVLARQLQEQFDLEDSHVQKGPHLSDAENIRMSMFSFERDNAGADGRTGYRGRGRGRGRGRRGGRSRG